MSDRRPRVYNGDERRGGLRQTEADPGTVDVALAEGDPFTEGSHERSITYAVKPVQTGRFIQTFVSAGRGASARPEGRGGRRTIRSHVPLRCHVCPVRRQNCSGKYSGLIKQTTRPHIKNKSPGRSFFPSGARTRNTSTTSVTRGRDAGEKAPMCPEYRTGRP